MRKLLFPAMAVLHVGLAAGVATAEPSASALTQQDVVATLKSEGLHLNGLTVTPNSDGRRSFGPSTPSEVLNVYVVEAEDGATQFVLVKYVPINDSKSGEGRSPPAFDVIARLARLADPSWSSAADDLFKGSGEAWRIGDQVTVARKGAMVHLAGSPPDLMFLLIVVAGACDLRGVLGASAGCDIAERNRAERPNS